MDGAVQRLGDESLSASCSLERSSWLAAGCMIGAVPAMKSLVRSAFRKFGFDLRRLETNSEESRPITPLEASLTLLLGLQPLVRIAQIGANDGRINDPIFHFASTNRDRVELLLIEPQQSLHPILEETYRTNPIKTLVSRAIGPQGEMTLYAINPTCWGGCKVPYASGWPSYRAPTGITSSSRQHVQTFFRTYYTGPVSETEAIVEIRVPSSPLIDVLESERFGTEVDLLQVDTEGFDDIAIYHSSVDQIRPNLINFETTHLTEENTEKLHVYLKELGYSINATGVDTLAILSDRVAPWALD